MIVSSEYGPCSRRGLLVDSGIKCEMMVLGACLEWKNSDISSVVALCNKSAGVCLIRRIGWFSCCDPGSPGFIPISLNTCSI